MEKPKGTRSKQEKQKMAISIGGGGGGNVGGVIVWGGVVAIATFVSVISAIKLRNKRLPNKTNQLEVNGKSSNDDQGKGLIVVLQDNSSPPSDYHPRFELNMHFCIWVNHLHQLH